VRWLLTCSLAFTVSTPALAQPEHGYHGALEAQSGWTWGEGDPHMERWGPSWAVRYWLRDVLALGLTGMVYTHDADTDFNFDVRRASRISFPLDEYQWQSEFTVTYAFLHGGRGLFHLDAYAVLGVGVLSTRAVPVFDPDHRAFDFRLGATFGGGAGMRIFISRWFATSLELRDFAWCGRHENETIAQDPTNRATWYGPTKVNDNVQLQLGFSIFAPL
jgi:hypothetical protein